MDVMITPSALSGRISAIGSKSDIHRLLICSAVSDVQTTIDGFFSSDDIVATVNCIRALGAKAEISGNICAITPIGSPEQRPSFDCGESGTTLRFILPIACALCENAEFSGRGRLPERPISELMEALESGGVIFSKTKLPFSTKGTLSAGKFFLPGNVSSQYISGLMTALCLIKGKSEISLTSPLESAGYVDMTLSSLRLFGADISAEGGKYTVYGKERLTSPGSVKADGDWSNALFFMTAGAVCGDIEITGLNTSSVQGDKKTVEILKRFGAEISLKNEVIKIKKSVLHGCDTDISQIPDSLPALSVVAAFAKGDSRFTGAGRLRLKESDRLTAVCRMINALGGKAEETDDGITVHGTEGLSGGTAEGENDHRIVMAATVAAFACKEKTVIKGAQAVNKSYPTFFEDISKLGGVTNVI